MADINPEKPITSANTPDPYGINAIDPETIKYLAFEGGGGKAIVYIGALHVLEALDILPYDPEKIKGVVNTNKLKGISGTSGGAINAFLVALGCTADEVREITGKGEDLARFYDEPSPGYYKAVVYNESTGKNESGYSTSKYTTKEDITYSVQSTDYFVDKVEMKTSTVIDTIWEDGSNFCIDENTAIRKGEDFIKIMKKYNGLGVTVKVGRKLIFNAVKGMHDPIGGDPQFLANFFHRKKFKGYVNCLLYDRGAFSGSFCRQFFRDKLMHYLELKFGVTRGEPSDENIYDPTNFHLPTTKEEIEKKKKEIYSNYTFSQFFQDTKMDLRITCTNITRRKPMEFSKDKTPDFPVADAISMSMSIPIAFKPTFVNAIVDKTRSKEYNCEYNGFYVDGGATNNLPIHSFDENKVFNTNVFGIRCTGGIDKKFFDYLNDDLYITFAKLRDQEIFDALKKMYGEQESVARYKYQKKAEQNEKISKLKGVSIQKDGSKICVTSVIGNSFSVVLGFFGDLYGSIDYWTEDGQMRDQEEIDRTIELFSYDVGLFDFDLSKVGSPQILSKFVQRTAAIKTAYKFKKYLGDTKFVSYKSVKDFKLDLEKQYLAAPPIPNSKPDLLEDYEYKIAKRIVDEYGKT